MLAKFDRTFWGMVVSFWLFWIVITSSIQLQQLLLGGVLAFLVAWFNNDLFFREDERSVLNFSTIMLYFRYLVHLLGAIVVANMQVVAIVLDPKMPISPGMVSFTRPFKKNLNKVILANSITLTPGTLTVLVEGDDFFVHALTMRNAESVAKWELADELAELEHTQEAGE